MKNYTKSYSPGDMNGPNNSPYIKSMDMGNMEEPDPAAIVTEGVIEGFGSWTLDENGLLIIDGTGKLPSWYNWLGRTAPWINVRDKIRSLHISGSVTEIGYHTFKGCTNLTAVSIPDSVTKLGDWAFEGCKSLTTVLLSKSIRELGEDVFCGCSSLTAVTIPNSVRKIGYAAFYKCTSLTAISIPDSVTEIGGCAFYGCQSLTAVSVPSSVRWIREDVFRDCVNLCKVTMPARFNRLFFEMYYGIPKSIVTFF